MHINTDSRDIRRVQKWGIGKCILYNVTTLSLYIMWMVWFYKDCYINSAFKQLRMCVLIYVNTVNVKHANSYVHIVQKRWKPTLPSEINPNSPRYRSAPPVCYFVKILLKIWRSVSSHQPPLYMKLEPWVSMGERTVSGPQVCSQQPIIIHLYGAFISTHSTHKKRLQFKHFSLYSDQCVCVC